MGAQQVALLLDVPVAAWTCPWLPGRGGEAQQVWGTPAARGKRRPPSGLPAQ